MGDGFDFRAKASASFTILFLDFLSAAASFGTISSNKTSTPMFAKWQAMREPMTPEPSTATFFIVRFITYLYKFFREDFYLLRVSLFFSAKVSGSFLLCQRSIRAEGVQTSLTFRIEQGFCSPCQCRP